jgi:pimeloyl-ACP methyl ester carboxylesterase
MRFNVIRFTAAVALAFLAGSCGRNAPLAPKVDSQLPAGNASAASRKAVQQVTGPIHEEGSLGPGALYSFDIPATWNGGLVLYVHGYGPPQAPVTIPSQPLRDFLLGQGFAVAMSSFSENGYAVAEGARQSHQLLGVFADRFGQPNCTLLMGVSLGGIIGLELTEKYPGQINGSLLVSGVVGGSRAEVNYIGDMRVLWDYFYPGTIPGSLFDVPEGVAFDPNWVLAAISTPDGQQKLLPLLAFAASRGLPIGPGNEPVVGLINALGFQWVGAADLFDRTHGHVLYDNTEVRYAAPGVPQVIADGVNAGVARYEATPDAEAFLRRCYEPRGSIKVPVLTLHGRRDPVVPIFHEPLLANIVAQNGDANLLVQRGKDEFGHVVFQPEDIPTAFLDLVQWVKFGIKPAS